jgi:hypothetical protein
MDESDICIHSFVVPLGMNDDIVNDIINGSSIRKILIFYIQAANTDESIQLIVHSK